MLYGSELWGTLIVDAMEKLLLKFCKYALYMSQPPVQTWQCWVNWEDALFTYLWLSELSSSSSDVKQEMYLR